MFSRVRHDEVRWSVYRSARSSQLNRRCVRACVRACLWLCVPVARSIPFCYLGSKRAGRACEPAAPGARRGRTEREPPTPNPKARTQSQRRDLDDFVIMSAETLEEMVQACESGFSNLALSSQVKSSQVNSILSSD
jgi:hypothetical protein